MLSECALDSSTTMVDLVGSSHRCCACFTSHWSVLSCCTQGCGDGRWLESVARLCGCRCWGVDIDTERCAHLKVDEVGWDAMLIRDGA